EVVVYPGAFRRPQKEQKAFSGEVQHVLFGEAHRWGLVVLSWPSVLAGFRDPTSGHNTGLHEFAHVLDVGNGSVFNGTPRLGSTGEYIRWKEVMGHYYERLREQLWRDEVLDPYGAKNEAEFFAVASEAFFERPHKMKIHAPELLELLQQFYGWDPFQFHEPQESSFNFEPSEQPPIVQSEPRKIELPTRGRCSM
ncbi:MAG: zinc-dependent peptidase, partial [Myxococcota bacterium]